MVLNAANDYSLDAKDSYSVYGPNSNTYVDNVIESTGATMPNIPGAAKQNYGENKNNSGKNEYVYYLLGYN